VGKRKDKARLALDVNGRGKRACSGPADARPHVPDNCVKGLRPA